MNPVHSSSASPAPSGFRRTAFALALPVLLALTALAPAEAATPASGSVSESNATVSWTGNPQPPTGTATCNGPSSAACDNFQLNILPPSGSFSVTVTVTPTGADDYDLEVYGPDGNLIDSSGNSPGAAESVLLLNPAAGTYTVSVANFAAATAYQGMAELEAQGGGGGPGDPANAVSFSIHTPPSGMGANAGEPSIGSNWNTDAVMFIAGLETLKVDFDDCTSPAKATWTDASFITTSITTLDPILFTDRETGRTVASQLGPKCSAMAFTDDDGVSYTPSQGCGINAGVDHQSVGGGPLAPPLTRDPNGPLYPNGIYYCSQDAALAQCAISLDGGLTFGAAVPIYTLAECGGLHGHVKVGPGGTAYVPNKSCNGEQAAVVSGDNGVTWDVRPVPGTGSGTWDPSVGIGNDGTVYIGMTNGGRPFAAVSGDQGVTWAHLQDVGIGVGPNGGDIRNTAFPVMVSGDGDRAAFGFLGAEQGGDGGADNPNSGHVWHAYVAVTYDRGQTWTTVNITPNDPVQRGTVFSGGFDPNGTSTRNLLDFNDMTIDREGRILFGFADGCIGGCAKQGPNSGTELGTIARQKSGKRLFAAFDAVDVPASPLVSVQTVDEGTANELQRVSWQEPFDGGSPITSYNVYRRREGEASETLLAGVGASVRSYDDTTTVPGFDYFYRVRAVNAIGEGASCGEVAPGGGVITDPPDEDVCIVPGQTVTDDPAGDTNAVINPTGDPSLDLTSLKVAEPFFADGSEKLVVTIQVDDLATPHPSAAWRALWTSPDGQQHFVSMESCDATVGIQCSYGTFDGTLFSSAGQPEGCSFDADGTITITVDKALVGISDASDAGSALTGFEGRTQVFFGAVCTGLLGNADSAGPGSHTLAGNASCAPDPPVANDDAAVTNASTPVIIDVVANDTSFNGDLTVVAVGSAANGTVSNNGDGTVTYLPDDGFVGVDSFSYTVEDEAGLQDSATVTVTVDEPNRNPQAVDDSATTDEDTPVTIAVLANDSDADGDPVTVTSVGAAADGTTVLNGDDTVTYTPDPDFSGTDSFIYEIADDRGGSSVATVTVTVNADGGGGGGGGAGGEGRVHGSGFWHTSGQNGNGSAEKLNFSFDAKYTASGLTGKLQINDKGAGVKIDARTITSLTDGADGCNGLSATPGSFELTASGDFNGSPAEFRACGVDNGDPGKGSATSPPDRFYVECVSGCSYDTAANTPDDSIDGGNIHLHDAIVPPSSAGGTSSAVAVRNGGDTRLSSVSSAMALPAPKVLELDPVLLTSGTAGAPQLLVAAAHAPDGVAVGGLAATLTWQQADGTLGNQTALTDALGVALFNITVLPGDTEYRVEIGDLDSNRIEITGTP